MRLRRGVLALFFGGNILWAQASATLHGRVQDPSGADVGRAAVSLANALTGYQKTTLTEPDGTFAHP